MKIMPDEITPEITTVLMSSAVDHVEPRKTYKAMLKAAPSPWISVEDRMPEEETECLVCGKDYGAKISRGMGVLEYAEKSPFPSLVKHWMTLPKPPK